MGEKLVCVYAYQIFREGETGYIPISPRGEIWYIIDFPGVKFEYIPIFLVWGEN